MFRRFTVSIAVLAVLLAGWFSLQTSSEPRPPYTTGRNNTILFLTNDAHGLSNVHVATSLALLEHHPDTEVHYVSFPGLAKKIARVSAAGQLKNAAAKPITWHSLTSAPSFSLVVAEKRWAKVTDLITVPGMAGVEKFVDDLEYMLCPWTAEQHWALYSEMREIIEQVDPAVIVLDAVFRPGMDLVRNMNRVNAILSPNALTDSFASKQPWGAMFWKYPPIASGYPFPVPWRLIPATMYLQLRFIIAIFKTPILDMKRAFLSERGVKDPINFIEIHREDVPWITMTLPEAGLPLDYLPTNVTECGPIVLDVAPVEEQGVELANWLQGAPTMLINLGSTVRYNEEMSEAVAGALVTVFETTDTQVVWKYRKIGDFNDDWRKPVEKYIQSGRLRLETWLKADPASLLATGQVVVSVHHGGANCFHETVLHGIPQVVLPLWVDLYNFAQIAEYLGVGIWPGQDTAPKWESKSLSEGFLTALSSASMREKAKALGEVARTYGGRDCAAKELAQLAASGY